MQVYGIIRLISQHQIEGGEAFELFYYVSNATYMVNEKKDDRREDFFEIYPYGSNRVICCERAPPRLGSSPPGQHKFT